MKNGFGRMLCLCLVLMMVTSQASASILGIGDTLPSFFDFEDETRFSMSLSLTQWNPYGEAELALINGLLQEMIIDTELAPNDTVFQFKLANEPLATFAQTGNELETTLLPNRVLTAQGDVLSCLLPQEENENNDSFDPLLAITQAEASYPALMEAIAPYGDEKSANYGIDNIGKSRWRLLAKLTPEQSTEVAPLLAEVLGAGMDEPYREMLRTLTYKKDLIVALYQTEEGGNDLAVYIKGTAIHPDESESTLSYQWAFDKEDTERRDIYEFSLTKSRPTDNRVIVADFQQENTSENVSVSGKSTLTLKTSEQTVVTTLQMDLAGAMEGDDKAFTGTHSKTVKTTIDDDSVSVITEMSPTLTRTDDGTLTGDVIITNTYDGKVQSLLNLHLDALQNPIDVATALNTAIEMAVPLPEMVGESSLSQNWDVLETQMKTDALSSFEVGAPPLGYVKYEVPKEPVTLSLDNVTSAQQAMVMDEMSQRLAGTLLSMLDTLPSSVTALMASGMLEKDFDIFMSTVSNE